MLQDPLACTSQLIQTSSACAPHRDCTCKQFNPELQCATLFWVQTSCILTSAPFCPLSQTTLTTFFCQGISEVWPCLLLNLATPNRCMKVNLRNPTNCNMYQNMSIKYVSTCCSWTLETLSSWSWHAPQWWSNDLCLVSSPDLASRRAKAVWSHDGGDVLWPSPTNQLRLWHVDPHHEVSGPLHFVHNKGFFSHIQIPPGASKSAKGHKDPKSYICIQAASPSRAWYLPTSWGPGAVSCLQQPGSTNVH